jgi:phosphate uptake regulator
LDLRKIQETRGGTFFVTLPKSWAIDNSITKGTFVSTSISSNGQLFINPRYDLEPALISSVIKPNSYLAREIIGKYLLGCDVIRVESKDRITIQQREIVKHTSSRLIGLEIIEEDFSNIILQCLLQPSAFPPEKILRREHLITSSMYKDAISALIDNDIQLAKNVMSRDNEVNRLYFLLVRILRTVIQNPSLSEKLKIDPIDCLDYRLTASLIESIGDQSAQIAEIITGFDDLKFTKEDCETIIVFHKIIFECYEDAIRAFFSRNISMADNVRKKKVIVEKQFQKVDKILNHLSIETSQKLVSITSLIRRIYDYSVDISDLTTPKAR